MTTTTETHMTTSTCPICGDGLRRSDAALRCDTCELDYEPDRADT
ncbi:hypothetical protein [Gryllotalpicola daejeonensis]